jgi:Uma2 family endonuclease
MIDKHPNLSFAEFVAWEKEQTQRHELVGGRVVPFLDASLDHETIAVNIIAKLHAAVEPPCKVFGSAALVETKSRVGEDYYRPDVTVSCDPENVGTRLYVVKPRLIVEVLSRSNFGTDWNTKLFEYWNTPGLEQLVLVDSLERHVTSYLRAADGTWRPELSLSGGEILFAPVQVVMSLAGIYENTSLAASFDPAG